MAGQDLQRVYGIDFSGGKKAGDKIWITSGSIEEAGLFIEGCFPARDLPDSARDRDTCLSALKQFIKNKRSAAFGLDFPFGLPQDVINGYSDWEDFVKEFSKLYEGPEHLHEECKAAGREVLDDGVEIRRGTDHDADAPFCPYNWRIKHQTYYGIGHLLASIVEDDVARVLPMQHSETDLPWIIEVCPSSTLGDRGLPRSGYKGRGEEYAQTRRSILNGLEDEGVILSDGIRTNAIEDAEGDAVDSLVAALATFRGVQNESKPRTTSVEGYIHV